MKPRREKLTRPTDPRSTLTPRPGSLLHWALHNHEAPTRELWESDLAEALRRSRQVIRDAFRGRRPFRELHGQRAVGF